MLLTESDLLLAGYLHTPQLADMLRAIEAMEARGIRDPAYAMKLLRRDFPPPETKLRLKAHPGPLAAAITATSPLEAQNIGAVRRSMEELLRVPVIQRGALMPDACPTSPAFASIPVGGAIAAENAIIPGAHSEDVCCSMYASFYHTDSPIATQLDLLMASTRFGPGGRKEEDWIPHPVLHEDVWENPYLQGLERHAAMHLGDQGDGNHFASIGRATFTPDQIQALHRAGHQDLAKALTPAGPTAPVMWHVLVTHHGSRGLGAHLFKRGQKAAEKQTAKIAAGIPLTACWLDATSPEGLAYWEALQYVGRWTRANHQCIHRSFLTKLGSTSAAAMGNGHNFVWKRGTTYYHGKGATPAWPDEAGRPQLGLIPLHMAAPILLVLGRDNAEFLSFAPHGAGRNLSRRAATKPFRQEDGTINARLLQKLVREQTPGLDIRWWHGKADLSETPLAYKSAPQVKAQIEHFDLAEIITEIQPLGCLMAGDGGPRPWARDLELTPKQKRQIEHRAARRKQHQHQSRFLTHGDDDNGEA